MELECEKERKKDEVKQQSNQLRRGITPTPLSPRVWPTIYRNSWLPLLAIRWKERFSNAETQTDTGRRERAKETERETYKVVERSRERGRDVNMCAQCIAFLTKVVLAALRVQLLRSSEPSPPSPQFSLPSSYNPLQRVIAIYSQVLDTVLKQYCMQLADIKDMKERNVLGNNTERGSF